MTQASRRYAKGEASRERIIEAARMLFGSKGFHATTTADLAAEASVSMGQLYSHFAAKSDIVVAIVENEAQGRLARMHAIFEAVERGDSTMFQAIQGVADTVLSDAHDALFFEILAEACRNPAVWDHLARLTGYYGETIRHLAALAKPEASAEELDAYVDVMMACFIGLGYRKAILPVAGVDKMSRSTALMLTRALGLPEAQ